MIKAQEIYYPLYQNKDKFIILVTGGRGCERPTQEVIMADLTVKKIKDIKVGDLVMGDDGTPRTVLATMSGRSEMYCVHQTSAEDYYVNDAHILSLRKSNSSMQEGRYGEYAEFTDMNVLDYASKSNRFREHFRGYKVSSIPYPESEVKIDPYLLGVWLGDGTSVSPQITTPDEEIKQYLQEYADTHGMRLALNGTKGKTQTFRIAKVGGHHNPLLDNLRAYGLISHKHIPQEYISNSERVRLELLAGLLDTDGHQERNGYEIIQKSETLAKQIKFIADTLGFRTSISTKKAKIYDKDCGMVYRVFINGDTWKIPCKVARKQVKRENVHKNKDWHLSQLSVESVGVGDWCGICLDGNQRYLHSDGTVTHNSGKSFNASAFVERLTFEKTPEEGLVHQILYTRYTMTSASISIIPEMLEKIELDETEKYFSSTKTDIVNRMTGSRIMFRGIKTSSGNQTAKLKSIHGITTFVCDEAEEWISENDFDKLMLSIRQKGIQNRIIIVMNPTDSNHFIYKKYIEKSHRLEYFDGVPVQISTHPNVLHIHTTYLDNVDNLSPQFIEEVERMKVENPEKYAHTVMGRWSDVAEGAVFKKWGIVDKFPDHARKVAIGIDFGYSRDVTAIVKCGVVDNALYCEELCYKTGMLSSDIIKELKKYDLFVYADSADPRLIDEIGLGGVIIYPVQKGPGSIIAGIEKIKDMELFVTKDSYNLQNELRNYVWAKDKNGNYINEPEDANNHCFVGETLVATDKGEKRIDEVQEGDYVLTSDGYRRVNKFFDNGRKRVVHTRLRFKNFTVDIKATPDHKIKTLDGWKELRSLTTGDILYLCKSSMTKCIDSSTVEHNTVAEGVQDNIMQACELIGIELISEEEQNVYDIEVDDMHEFFANGILVHNCVDATRYYTLSVLLGKVMKPRNINKSDLGIW